MTIPSRKRYPIQIVQGAQWGSEGKGAIAAWLCFHDKIDYAVRTGTVNAGHTVYYKGKPFKMQQIPTGWVRPETQLVIGPGALISPDIISREIMMINEATGRDVRSRLYVDWRCGVHLPVHTDRSTASGRHHSIGATGKGSSEALIDKIRGRGKGYKLYSQNGEWSERGDIVSPWNYCDTSSMLNHAFDRGERILLEGTQGTFLDLHLGPYPYTTHKQTLPGQWLTEAGLSPSLPVEVVLVVRTKPIRVAGNSGPMPGETSWPLLVADMNDKLGTNVIDSEAVPIFERLLEQEGKWRGLPEGLSATAQHTWTSAEREEWKEPLSEMNAAVLNLMKEDYSYSYKELCRVFEFTTVTGKLRRIANINNSMMIEAMQLNRPSRVALTFCDYEWPRMWDCRSRANVVAELTGVHQEMYDFCEEFGAQDHLAFASFGPQHHNIFAL